MRQPKRSSSHGAFRIERRRMLQGTGLLGLAAVVPPLLGSCSSDSGDGGAGAQPTTPREARDLHFDLSLATVREPKLFALRSQHHGAPLHAHSAESRQRHRALNAALRDVADDRLTHYLEGADLPAGALQAVLVTGTDPATGRPVLAGAHVHAPRDALRKVAERRAKAVPTPAVSAKRHAYGIGPRAVGDALPEDLNAFAGPFDVATYLVFHHPEVMNLNPDLGADILARIEALPCDPNDTTCTPFLGTLAFKIATLVSQKGYPSTAPGSWATLVAQTYGDGTPVLDGNGQPVYRYDLNDDIAQATGDVVRQIKKNISNDPLFEGTNWQATQGIVNQSAAAGVASAPARSGIGAAVKRALGKDTFGVQAKYPPGATIDGIKMVALEVTDATDRVVRLTVANEYLRFLSIYMQYLDANGAVLPVDDPGELDSTRATYLTVVGPNNQIMGIPFTGGDVPTTDIEFTMPAGAASANVMFGSLGLGGDAFTKEAVIGSILTLTMNIGIPTILLATGVYSDLKAGWEGIFKDETLLKLIMTEVLAGLKSSAPDLAEGVYTSASTLSATPFITGLANVAIHALLSVAPSLALELAATIGSLQLVLAIPFVGVALKVLSVLADLAAIAETIGEVFASQAIRRNGIALTMDSTVRISRDPRDFQFPASATRYRVEGTYDGAVPRFVEGTLTQGRVDPVDAVLTGVPSGGTVVFKVSLYSSDGCLVGVKQTDPIANLPATAGLVPVQIVELVAPLKADTSYQHRLKLLYQNGAHVWAGAPAPQLTRANLCQGASGAICGLNGLTVHTATGMAGYGFDAGGQNVGVCGGSSSSGSLNTFQNVFLGQNPQRALKFSGCGFTQPVGIVYDPLGPAVGGHNFFVQPASDGFHLRSVTLDDTTPFDLAQTRSWGRFSNALDSLAVVPSGFVVGVNRQTHKMEILELPSQAVDQSLEPRAVPFAAMKAGQGSRPGLLDTPVAVASAQGAILVLEQGNARVQAFDVHGNPTPLFSGATTALMPLQAEAGAVYLDLAVEGLGYMYVLSYVNNGLVPSSYRLDLYTPDGAFLARTTGVAAGRLAVDLFRNLYTLNYEPIQGAPRVEPSLSQWSPVTANACPSTLSTASSAVRDPGCARLALA